MTPDELKKALEPTRKQLERIATALETIVAAMQEPKPTPEAEPPTCPHPPEQRSDFGLTNGKPDWECRACGYRTDTSPDR